MGVVYPARTTLGYGAQVKKPPTGAAYMLLIAPDPDEKLMTLSIIAFRIAESDSYEKIPQIIQEINALHLSPSDSNRMYIKSDILRSFNTQQLRKDKPDEALAVAEKIESKDSQASSFLDIANYYIEKKEFERAYQVYEKTKNGHGFGADIENMFLANIAMAKVKMGAVDEAIALAETLSKEEDRIMILSDIASTLYKI